MCRCLRKASRQASPGSRSSDHIVTGGGGAPPYWYSSEPDLTAYLRTNAGQKVDLEHVARPGTKAGDNPYHFVLVRVDGNSWEAEVIGVDWGRGFAPYRLNRRRLGDDTPNP